MIMTNINTSRKDNSPYQIDDSVYKRFDARNAFFSRFVWDTEYAAKIAKVRKLYKDSDPGYSHLDSALVAGAQFGGIANEPLATDLGQHTGLLSFENNSMNAVHGPIYDERWDYSNLAPEEVAASVKKAALFYGASLVGIAPFDERWIYSRYYDLRKGIAAPIEISQVEEVVLPPGQLSSADACKLVIAEFKKMEAEKFKALLVEVVESADQSMLPSQFPPAGMIKSLPAGMIKDTLSSFTALPTGMLRIFGEKLGMDFVIAEVDPAASAKPRYLEDGTLAIPSTMKSVIVLGFQMDLDCMEASPTTLGDAASMDGYAKMAVTAGSMARFLMALGYNAIPCGNNTGLSIPMAIDAGLGELGRLGILITPKYGPRIRLAKVITDLPMAYGSPKPTFGFWQSNRYMHIQG